MKRNLPKISKILQILSLVFVPLTIVLYFVRGFGFLGFLPGGFLLLTIIISFFSVLGFLIMKTLF